MIFEVGIVPSGAILVKTPCRSMPASAKLGRGAASCGSNQVSRVLRFVLLSVFRSAESFGESLAADICGLEYRDRVALPPRADMMGVACALAGRVALIPLSKQSPR